MLVLVCGLSPLSYLLSAAPRVWSSRYRPPLTGGGTASSFSFSFVIVLCFFHCVACVCLWVCPVAVCTVSSTPRHTVGEGGLSASRGGECHWLHISAVALLLFSFACALADARLSFLPPIISHSLTLSLYSFGFLLFRQLPLSLSTSEDFKAT